MSNVYDYPATRLEWQGSYTLEIGGYTQYKGTRHFTVNPLVVQSATFAGVPASIPVNTALPAFTVTFKDKFLNLVNHVGTVMYRNTSNASVMGSIATSPTGLGVVTAQALTFASVGDFALSVGGIVAGNTLGTKGFVVLPEVPPAPNPIICGNRNTPDSELSGTALQLKQYQETVTQQYLTTLRSKQSAKTNALEKTIIPVVVHVVSSDLMRERNVNITDADIINQLESLNREMLGLNPGFADVVEPFKSLRGTMNIEFQLAKRDENGWATNGINRVNSTATGRINTSQFTQLIPENFAVDADIPNSIQRSSLGWDPHKYLNIWIFDGIDGRDTFRDLDQSTIFGYATLPYLKKRSPVENVVVDGVYINYVLWGTNPSYIQNIGMGLYTPNKILYHEVGHWLNLLHIFGCGDTDDLVDDTPTQSSQDVNCPANNNTVVTSTSCENTTHQIMHQNHMGYNDVNCKHFFSQGQVARMEATLYGKVRGNYVPLDGSGLRGGISLSDGLVEGKDWGTVVGAGSLSSSQVGRYSISFDVTFPVNLVENTEWQVQYQDHDTQEWSSSWISLGTGLEKNITMFATADRMRIRAVLTNTRKNSTVLPFVTVVNSSYIPLVLANASIAPNPVNTDVTVSYQLNEAAQVGIEVYNAMSTLAATLQSPTPQSSGMNSGTFPLGSLSSGMYSVRIRAEGTNGNIQYITQPLVIVR